MVDRHHDVPGAGDGLCNGIVEQASRAKSRREDYNGKPEVGAFRRLWPRLKGDELDRPPGKSHCAVYVGVVFGCCGGQVVYLLEVDFAVAGRRRSKSSDVWSSGSKRRSGSIPPVWHENWRCMHLYGRKTSYFYNPTTSVESNYSNY